MDLKQLFTQEADALIADIKSRADSFLAKANAEDRQLMERTLARAAVVQAGLLLDPSNTAAVSEMASLANTLRFAEAKYQIRAGLELRQFVSATTERVASFLLKAAFAAVAI